MESIQAKVVAAGGEGIGLRLDDSSLAPKRRGRKPKAKGNVHKKEDTDGDDANDAPWEALEAIMSMGEVVTGTSEEEGETPSKRKFEESEMEGSKDGEKSHRLAKMSKSEDDDTEEVNAAVSPHAAEGEQIMGIAKKEAPALGEVMVGGALA